MIVASNDSFVQFTATAITYEVNSAIGPVLGFADMYVNDAALLFIGLLGITITLRIILANLPKSLFVNRFINENLICIIVGCIFGGIFQAANYTPLLSGEVLFVLVSIVLFDDGFSVESDFRIWTNVSRMMLFGVLGTVINTISIGFILWGFSTPLGFTYSLLNLLMFSALINILDPLSVLPLIKKKPGTRDLCTSEALINPIVAISLFLMFAIMRKFASVS
jgi:hypothetical protein